MNERARSLLEGYVPARTRITTLTSELESLATALDTIRSAGLPAESGMSLAAASGSMEKLLARFEEEICAASSRCELTHDALSSLGDTEMREVLELHYLHGKTLSTISGEKYWCLTKVKKLHREGLSRVESYLEGVESDSDSD